MTNDNRTSIPSSGDWIDLANTCLECNEGCLCNGTIVSNVPKKCNLGCISDIYYYD